MIDRNNYSSFPADVSKAEYEAMAKDAPKTEYAATAKDAPKTEYAATAKEESMTEMTNRNSALQQYTRNTHLIGRICTAVCLVMFIGAPFVIGLYLGALPDLGAAAKAFISVGLVWTVSSVAEFLIYTPLLGSGGGYLAFITGNLINMKIPCAMSAREIAGTKAGTPENEIISTLSIASSSLVTIIVLAIGVAALVPLQPVLQSPVLTPAFDNVVPALFGAMACQYFRKDLKLAVVPLLAMSVLFVLVPSLAGSASLMILPAGALSIGLAWLKFRKETAK